MSRVAKVTLDRDTFKALASETRLDVLHALDDRRKTGSELARELELNKATVHEHLQILAATGLISKLDEGRKWIYWELTWEGKKLLHPEAGTTFSVLLGLSALAAGGGIVSLGRALGWWLMDSMPAPAQETAFAPEEEREESETAADEATETEAMESAPQEEALAQDLPSDDGGSMFFDDGGWLAIALLLSCALMVGLAVWLRRRS